MRASSRATPYECFANVSIVEFGLNTNIEKEDEIIDTKVDTDWANGLIKKLEDDSTILKSLSLKFNDICYVSGDRLKNPYFTNRGNLKESTEEIKESSIRFANLVGLVKDKSKDFIKYNDLFYFIF
ncbi:lantibiotic dehydratase [Peptoniphilus porci]|uniref:lantibiotic dehydratase n=1 Tax=Peptoniphilus porci TaxID=2652280 RepID=UPI0009F842D5